MPTLIQEEVDSSEKVEGRRLVMLVQSGQRKIDNPRGLAEHKKIIIPNGGEVDNNQQLRPCRINYYVATR